MPFLYPIQDFTDAALDVFPGGVDGNVAVFFVQRRSLFKNISQAVTFPDYNSSRGYVVEPFFNLLKIRVYVNNQGLFPSVFMAIAE
jgi:hypothetical protein